MPSAPPNPPLKVEGCLLADNFYDFFNVKRRKYKGQNASARVMLILLCMDVLPITISKKEKKRKKCQNIQKRTFRMTTSLLILLNAIVLPIVILKSACQNCPVA